MSAWWRAWAAMTALAWGFGCTKDRGLDPQEPLPNGASARAQVVICPDGSTYDPQRNNCIKLTPVPATPLQMDAAPQEPTEE